MRRGIINDFLNIAVTLVTVGIVFSASFYVYNTFIASTQKTEAMLGFEKFVSTISEACTSSSQNAVSFSVRLPVNDYAYVYGVFQTKINPSDAYYNSPATRSKIPPQMLEKCTDEYCLCLFQMRRKRWSSWKYTDDSGLWLYNNNDAAPLWHFNSPGIVGILMMLPKIITRMIINLVQEVFFSLVLPIVLGQVGCCSAGGPAALLTCSICMATIYFLLGFAWEFIEELIFAATEPIAFFNYPENLITQSNINYLDWRRSDGDFDCYTYLQQSFWDALLDIIGDAALAGVEEGLERAIDGAIQGMGMKGTGGKLLFGGVKNFFAKIGLKALLKFYEGLALTPLKHIIAKYQLDTPAPQNINAECYTSEMLSKRQITHLFDFVTWGRATAPDILHDAKVYDMFPGDFNVQKCFSVRELGPNCDYQDSAVKVITDSEFFLVFRYTDPVNEPLKAIYCGYTSGEKDYEENIFDMLFQINCVDVNKDGSKCSSYQDYAGSLSEDDWLDAGFDSSWYGKKEVETAWDPANWVWQVFKGRLVPEWENPLGWLLEVLVGDVLLAGKHSVKGLFIDCQIPQIVDQVNADYLQAWVPYPDLSNLYGFDGNIMMMKADVTKQIDSLIKSCKYDALMQMANCTCKDDIWNSAGNPNPPICVGGTVYTYADITEYIASYSYYGWVPSIYATLNARRTAWLGTLSTLQYDLLITRVHDYLHAYARDTIFRSPSNTDFTAPSEVIMSCYDYYEKEYLKCSNGIYIELTGVIK